MRSRLRLLELPEPASRPRLRANWAGGRGRVPAGLSVLTFAFLFIFLKDATAALRISNGVAIVMLFAGGYVFANYA